MAVENAMYNNEDSFAQEDQQMPAKRVLLDLSILQPLLTAKMAGKATSTQNAKEIQRNKNIHMRNKIMPEIIGFKAYPEIP